MARILPQRRRILATHTHLAEVLGQSRVCVLPALFPIQASRPGLLLRSWAAQAGLGSSPAAQPSHRRMGARCLPGFTHFKNLLKQNYISNYVTFLNKSYQNVIWSIYWIYIIILMHTCLGT